MNRLALHQAAQAWARAGQDAVVVTVADARGSVPREAGTRMVVGRDAVLGTIGGGHLEWDAIATARRALQPGQCCPPPMRRALGPSLGQCCGGVVTLAFERLSAALASTWTEPEPRARLCLYGAGHVGVAIARLLGGLDVAVRWIDTREEAFPASGDFDWARSPWLQPIVSDSPAHEAAASQACSHHLVMTHSHALDFDIVLALLARGDTGSIGLIGSATKRARFEHRLAARGIPPTRLADLRCPIGLPGITGKEPAMIALSVVADWVKELPAHRPMCGNHPTTMGPPGSKLV